MTLESAYQVIRSKHPDAALHFDHICPDSCAHDLLQCPFGEERVYTEKDAKADTADALQERL
jgi:hypothetical protein